MEKDEWIQHLMEDELSHLFLIGSMKSNYPNMEIRTDLAGGGLALVQNNGVNCLGGFHAQSEEALKSIAEWFGQKGCIVEACYDQMVKLRSAMGMPGLPARFYLLKHDGLEKEPFERRLTCTIVTDVASHEAQIKKGLQEIFKLKPWEVSRLLKDKLFLDYLERGVHMFTKGSEFVGFIHVKNRTDNYAELSHLWIRKSLRGKGYSNEIIRTMIQMKKEKGQTCLICLPHDSRGMLRLFENEGFELARVLSRENLK